MLSKDMLINLADKYYLEIVFKRDCFKITTPDNFIFYDGKKTKEYLYEDFLVKSIDDAKQNAILYAYFEIKNNTFINLKDKKFETVKSNSNTHC